MKKMRIGIDVGGTKIEGIAMDQAGSIIARERVKSPRNDYKNVVTELKHLVLRLEETSGMQGSVGIGIPGSLHPDTGLVRNANLTVINGHPLDQDLAREIGRPVRIANDANCFALSEATDGAGAERNLVFGIILGTGCGGGVVYQKSIWIGRNGIAGEWGHNPIPAPTPEEWPGPRCYCGRTGCIETFVSGTGLERDYKEHSSDSLSARDITILAEEGHPSARAALSRLHLRLAKSLAQVINVLDPDTIVIGGGLSNIPSLYDEVPRLWSPFIFGDASRTELKKAVHGDSSGVRGAAWLWPDPSSGVPGH